jgi:acyl-CoA synthetase (AMP-forming)/AMP-acid ligase II
MRATGVDDPSNEGAAYHMTLPESECTAGGFIRSKAARDPERVFIVKDGVGLGYGEAERRSRKLARGLLAAGVGKGTRVALLLPNGPDWVLAWLAAARIGALVVPLNTFYQARELGFVLRHADVHTLLTAARFLNNDYLERLEKFAPELASHGAAPLRLRALPYLREVRVWEGDGGERAWTSGGASALEALADANPAIDDALLAEAEREVRPADPMVVIYSSGSTADPKGAVHTHGTVLRHAHNLNGFRDLTRDDRIYSPMPFFWVGGLVFTLVSTMHVGARLYCQDAFEPGKTLDLIERERITLVAGWPHFGAAMAAHPSFASRDLTSIRAGNMYALLPESARPKDPELRSNSLGMTETCGPHTYESMDRDLPEKLRGSFGRGVPGTWHKIVDPETGRTLGPGEFGEICVRGYSVMQGLYKVEREDAFDADGYYHTGDAGFFDAEGHLFFKGRLGEMIKTGGANVAPREVELLLAAMPEVLSAHVVGLPHRERGETVAAAVVLRDGAALDAATLLARLKDDLSAYKLPRHVFFVSGAEVPLTDSGKLDRRKLRDALAQRAEDAS